MVHCAALMVARHDRARWREEWLGEIDAATPSMRLLRRALGAPKDALAARSSRRGALAPRTSAGLWARGYFGVASDVRDALRSLGKTPLQALTIIGCLAIGSAVTVLMFGILNAMVAGDLPGVRDRSELVSIQFAPARGTRLNAITMGQFQALPRTIPGLAATAAELPWRFSTNAAGRAAVSDGAFVSGSYFTALGTTPKLGRLLQPADDRPGSPLVVVIGHGFWLSMMGGRPDTIGSTISIGDSAYEIVGVAPSRFVGIDMGDFGRESAEERGDVWLPMSQMWLYPDYAAARAADAVGPRLVARLEPDLDRAGAEARAQSIVSFLNAASSDDSQVSAVRFRPFQWLPGSRPGQNALFISLVMSLPFLVLAVACANVAGVQLARAVARTHELAVRVALGATRSRVVRLLVIETLLVAVMAGTVSWFLASETMRLAAHVLPFAPVSDIRVLAFSVALPLGVTLMAGLFPAWRASGFDTLAGLRLGARVGKSASPRLRRAVLVTQIALSALLIIATAAFVRGLNFMPTAIGAPLDDVFIAETRFGDLRLGADGERRVAAEITSRLAALPGVRQIALSDTQTLHGSNAVCWSAADKPRVSERDVTLAKYVTPNYFDVIKLRPTDGRTFRAGDDDVVIVNQTFIDLQPAPSPHLGSVIRVRRGGSAPSTLARIIGIVPASYERAPRGQARGRCYLPFDPALRTTQLTAFLESSSAGSLRPAVLAELSHIDQRLSPVQAGTLAAIMRERFRALYWIADIIGAVGIVTVVLAAVGLFGAMSYATSLRTHEFGVRLALGARPAALATSIVREAIVVTGAGLVIGALLAIPLTSFLRSAFISTISLNAPLPLLGVAGVFALVAVSAALLPARRASALNPVTALRAD